jgi:hypothetical protein
VRRVWCVVCGVPVLEDFDYSFSENGLVAYKDGQLIGRVVRPRVEQAHMVISGTIILCSHFNFVPNVIRVLSSGSDRTDNTCLIGRTTHVGIRWRLYAALVIASGRLRWQTLNSHLGEDNIKAIVNWTLRYLSEIDIPVKRSVPRRPCDTLVQKDTSSLSSASTHV